MKQAIARNLLVAPRKLRLIADSVTGREIGQADQLLQLLPHHGAWYLRKALNTATHNLQLSKDSRIKSIEVNEGMKLKRFVLALRGVARPYFKARSHVRFTFDESKSEVTNIKSQKSKKAEKHTIKPKSDNV